MVRKIKFKEEDYILVGEGAITTENQYKHGRISFCHLGEDGIVRRYGKEIGTKNDIEYGDEMEVEIAEDAWENLFYAMEFMLFRFGGQG